MNRAPDHYATLQVDPRAEPDIIEAAYRRLAVKYHPDIDRSPGATQRMARINAAYEVLSDPAKRRVYDLQRRVFPHVQPEPQPQQAPRGNLSQWLTSTVLTIVLLAITAGGAQFGVRGLLLVGLLVLVGWLIMAYRRG